MRSSSHIPSGDGESRGQLLRLIGGTAFIFACRVAGAALTFGSQILLARWMGAAEFGTYVIAFSWCILLSTLATGGMAQGALRYIGAALAEGRGDHVRGYVRAGLEVTIAGGLGVMLVGALLLVVIDPATAGWHRLPVAIALATVPWFAVLNFYSGAANAFPWIAQSFLPTNVVRPLLFLVAIVVLAGGSKHYSATDALLIQWVSFAVVAVVAGLAFHVRLAREVPPAPRHYERRTWLRTALPLLGVSLFSTYLPELTVVIAGFYLPPSEVGVFQVSYRIALLIAFGLYAVDSFTAPEAARLAAVTDQAKLQATTNRATALRFWPSLVAVAVFVVAGKLLLGIFGAEFVAGYPVLVVLAVGQLVTAAVGPVNRLMMVSGHQDRALVASMCCLGLLVPLVVGLSVAFGAMGTAFAALIDITLWSLWMRYLVVKSLGIRPSIF